MSTSSPEQDAVFYFVELCKGNGIVSAVAGSGKTWTLVAAAHLLPPAARAAFAAFNRHICIELTARLLGTAMRANTLNGHGHALLSAHLGRNLILRRDKYTRLARHWLHAHYGPPSDCQAVLGEFVELLDLARLRLADGADERALLAVAHHFNLVLPASVLRGVAAVLSRGELLAARRGEIDFTDQLWLPERWDLQPPRLDWLFVDEAQDLSPAAQALALRLAERYLLVGDPAQAIMGFAGSDCDSFDTLCELTQARVLPLSVCRRCPRSHLRLARQIVPHIQARPDAAEGQVSYVRERNLASVVQGGDLVICRTLAPLISACLRLVRNGVLARVRGEQVSSVLLSILNEVAERPGFRYQHFEGLLDEYEAERAEPLTASLRNLGRIQALHDRCQALRSCYAELGAHDLASLEDKIRRLFDSHCANPVWLSTVHRTKGLEARRVFLLEPHRLPLEWPDQQEWEWRQEA